MLNNPPQVLTVTCILLDKRRKKERKKSIIKSTNSNIPAVLYTNEIKLKNTTTQTIPKIFQVKCIKPIAQISNNTVL